MSSLAKIFMLAKNLNKHRRHMNDTIGSKVCCYVSDILIRSMDKRQNLWLFATVSN